MAEPKPTPRKLSPAAERALAEAAARRIEIDRDWEKKGIASDF
jgi:hypothetical protein